MVDNFRWRYGKVLSIAFCSCFLISNDNLPRNAKTQSKSFLVQYKSRCLINTSSKYIFMQRLTKSLGYLLVLVCFSFWFSKSRVILEEQITKPRCSKVEIRLYLYDMGKKKSKLVNKSAKRIQNKKLSNLIFES